MYSVDPLLYRCPSGFGPSTKLSENIILDVLVVLIYVPVRTKVCFRFKTCNWRLEMTLRDSRTPLDSIGDKLLTPIYFVIVQCLSVCSHLILAYTVRLAIINVAELERNGCFSLPLLRNVLL